MNTAKLLVTVLLSGEAGRTDLALAFDEGQMSPADFEKAARLAPILLNKFPPRQAGRIALQSIAKVGLCSALDREFRRASAAGGLGALRPLIPWLAGGTAALALVVVLGLALGLRTAGQQPPSGPRQVTAGPAPRPNPAAPGPEAGAGTQPDFNPGMPAGNSTPPGQTPMPGMGPPGGPPGAAAPGADGAGGPGMPGMGPPGGSGSPGQPMGQPNTDSTSQPGVRQGMPAGPGATTENKRPRWTIANIQVKKTNAVQRDFGGDLEATEGYDLFEVSADYSWEGRERPEFDFLKVTLAVTREAQGDPIRRTALGIGLCGDASFPTAYTLPQTMSIDKPGSPVTLSKGEGQQSIDVWLRVTGNQAGGIKISPKQSPTRLGFVFSAPVNHTPAELRFDGTVVPLADQAKPKAPEKEEPDQAFLNAEMDKLEALQLRAFPFYAKGKGGKIELEDGKTVHWNENVAAWLGPLGWAWSSAYTFRPQDDGLVVFFNAGPTPVAVGDVTLNKGEMVLLKDQKLIKVTHEELKARNKK
jgi:hypothetical protein